MIKDELRSAHNVVSDRVSLAKAAWSTHEATITHNMKFTPKYAWVSVKVLSGGMTSNHEKPIVMRLRLTNGELATTDAEMHLSWDHTLKRFTETTNQLTGQY